MTESQEQGLGYSLRFSTLNFVFSLSQIFICWKAPGQPEALAERVMRKAEIGDILVIDGSGAYCAGMSTKNYNSFPEAPEVMVDEKGKPYLIRKKQTLEQIIENEITPTGLTF